MQVQQPFSSDHSLQPDVLEAASSSTTHRQTSVQDATPRPASQVHAQASAPSAHGHATDNPEAKQSPLRKNLSWLFGIFSPEKTQTSQRQSCSPRTAFPSSPCASPGAFIPSAPSHGSPAMRQISAAALLSPSALQAPSARQASLPNTLLHTLHSATALSARPDVALLNGQPDAVAADSSSNLFNWRYKSATGDASAAHVQYSVEAVAGSMHDRTLSTPAMQPPSPTPTPPAALRYSAAPSSSSVDHAGQWVQSPTGRGIGRSMSETVQQLSADVQLSRDCAAALSMQLGSQADVQQLQGRQLTYKLSHSSRHVCSYS